jgi:hypothetical protein
VGLIRSAMVCHKCGSQMSWCVDANRKDGYRWRCRRIVSASARSASTSIRHGSWFQQSNLNFMRAMFLNYDIVRRVPARTIQAQHHVPAIRTQQQRHYLQHHILRHHSHRPPQMSLISPSTYMPYTHQHTIFLRSSYSLPQRAIFLERRT